MLMVVAKKTSAEKFAIPHDVIEKLNVKTPVRIFTSDELKRYSGVDVSVFIYFPSNFLKLYFFLSWGGGLSEVFFFFCSSRWLIRTR